MSKNSINIDGEKLKSLLEGTTGKTVYQISTENGFSKNLISEAIRNNKASPIVQNIAKLYGIAPEAYKLKEETPTDEISSAPAQMSIDDFKALLDERPTYTPEDFKKAIIEGMFKAIEENIPYICAEIGKTTKGNVKAAIRETLISFGWSLKEGGKK